MNDVSLMLGFSRCGSVVRSWWLVIRVEPSYFKTSSGKYWCLWVKYMQTNLPSTERTEKAMEKRL